MINRIFCLLFTLIIGVSSIAQIQKSKVSELKEQVAELVRSDSTRLTEMIDQIFSYADLPFQESHSSSYLKTILVEAGFSIYQVSSHFGDVWYAKWGDSASALTPALPILFASKTRVRKLDREAHCARAFRPWLVSSFQLKSSRVTQERSKLRASRVAPASPRRSYLRSRTLFLSSTFPRRRRTRCKSRLFESMYQSSATSKSVFTAFIACKRGESCNICKP